MASFMYIYLVHRTVFFLFTLNYFFSPTVKQVTLVIHQWFSSPLSPFSDLALESEQNFARKSIVIDSSKARHRGPLFRAKHRSIRVRQRTLGLTCTKQTLLKVTNVMLFTAADYQKEPEQQRIYSFVESNYREAFCFIKMI